MANEEPDEKLMVAYQLGDESAFLSLYERHSGRVLGFLKKKIRDDALIQDVFQGTFMKLHNSRSKYNPAFPFVPWLFTICRSQMIDAFRKKSKIKEELVEALPETLPEAASEPADSTLTTDLTHLPPKQREALELRFTEDFSFEEIARRLETSPSNARQLVSRAVKFLRGSYGEK